MTDNKSKFLINVSYYAILSLLIIYLSKLIVIYLFPVIIGLLITVMVQKPARVFSKILKIRKGNCALILVIITYAIIIFLFIFLVFKTWDGLSQLFKNYSYIFEDISELLSEISDNLNSISDSIPQTLLSSVETTLNTFISSISSYISTVAKSTAKVMPLFFTGSIVTIIASCYIAKDYDRFKDSVGSVISKKYKIVIQEIKELLKNNLLKLIRGYLYLLIITFIELSIGLLLLGINDAILIAVIIALVDLLPIIGTGAVLIPWGVYQIIIGNCFLGIGLIILYLIILLVKNIIEPKIVGKQIGLHPLISLISLFIGFKLFGFIGIFALPLAVMLVWKMYERGIFSLVFDKTQN